FSVVEKRVVKEVERALNDYYTLGPNVFPPPAPFSETTCLGTAPITTGCSSNPSVNQGRIPANPTPAAWTPGAYILQGSPSSWFQANGWRELVYYAPAYACTNPAGPNCTWCSLNPTDPGCSVATGGGFITLNVPPGTPLAPPLAPQKVVVIAVGKAIGSQMRGTNPEKTMPSNYVELENANADNTYVKDVVSVNFNDRAVSVPYPP
ncbi:MAG: hypothetical protein ACREBC_30645, partial [Pyrinomonadaceae bacterium]